MLVAVATAALACGTEQPDENGIGVDPELVGTLTDDGARSAAEVVNRLGREVHEQLAVEGANTVTSPISLAALLALLAPGADGEAAQDLAARLGLHDGRDTSIGALLVRLADTSDVRLDVASSIWTSDGVTLLEPYAAFVRDTYGVHTSSVPLDRPEGATAIDQWVTDATNGRIEEMAAALGLPDPDALTVLLNAVYFKGTWTTEFDPADTRPDSFHLPDGSEVEVPMMSLSVERSAGFEVAHAEGFSLLRLPYGKEERFGLEVVLPDDVVDASAFLATLDEAAWADARARLGDGALAEDVRLPRFTTTWEGALDDALAAVGLGSIYAEGALPGISDSASTLSTVAQSVFIAVDEHGTEAAAATGGVMTDAASMPFVVDRPFVFAVSDRSTGAVLFLGTINDPTR